MFSDKNKILLQRTKQPGVSRSSRQLQDNFFLEILLELVNLWLLGTHCTKIVTSQIHNLITKERNQQHTDEEKLGKCVRDDKDLAERNQNFPLPPCHLALNFVSISTR